MVSIEMLSAGDERNRALFSGYLDMFCKMQFEQWGDRFWHPDGRFLVKYPIGAGPQLVGDGRAQIVANMNGLAGVVSAIKTSNLAVMQTLDPDCFIVQYQIEVSHPGGEYRNDLLSIVRLRIPVIVGAHSTRWRAPIPRDRGRRSRPTWAWSQALV